MQKRFLSACLFFIIVPYQSSIYDIPIESISGNNISMSSFANKKILITTFSSIMPNVSQLQYLDSLQNSNTSLIVIAVPANDFGGIGNDATLANLINSLSIDILILKSAYVKKNAGNNQQPLFKWLTNVNENNHFDVDVEAIGQMFIVSGNGILYSVLGENVPDTVLNQVLSQNLNQ